jgi:hypothetical protein
MNSGGKVDIQGPCGMVFGTLTASTKPASSYAAPAVAAATWLKRLIDGTTGADMRKELIHASPLTLPTSPVGTLGGGVFDPARLLALRTVHWVDTARAAKTLVTGLVIDAGPCGTFKTLPSAPASQDVLVYQDATGYALVYRHDVGDFPGVRVEPPCHLNTLTLTAATSSGTITIGSPQEFVRQIGYVTF